MKQLYVAQIQDRDEIETIFLLRSLELAVAKNGKPYLVLKLIDRTGEIEGRVWDNADALAKACAKDDFVLVRGRASIYLGKMQVVVKSLQKQDESNVDLADFLPVSRISFKELETRLRHKVQALETPHLRRLMESFLERPGFLEGYCAAPAAKSMHHAYLGGLLEHSLAVADLAEDVCGRYADLNRDLVVVGALLHDIGKISELQYRRSFEYTDAGKLLGHIMLGVQMVDEQITSLEAFPEEDAVHLKHLLVSHHGQYEFGSPKRPKTIEAIILSYVDDLDSKINGIRTHFEKEQHSSSSWTGYHRLYDQYFFKGRPPENCLEPAKDRSPTPNARPEKSGSGRSLGVSLADRLTAANIDLSVLGSTGEKDDH